MILIATDHARVEATGFGVALCQFCGKAMPQTHPQAIELLYSDCPRWHFTAVCEDCWQEPLPHPDNPTWNGPIVHPQETTGGGDRQEHGCSPGHSSRCPGFPPERTQRSESREETDQTPPGQENAPEATAEPRND